MEEEIRNSIFGRNIEMGQEAGLFSFNEDRSRITYNCRRNFTTSFKNPEVNTKSTNLSFEILMLKGEKENFPLLSFLVISSAFI